MSNQKTLCYDYALWYIQHFPKTEQELTIKLRQKGYNDIEIQKTFVILKQQKYLDDENFAKSYLRSEVANKGKPLFLIRKKLEMKGINKVFLDKTVREMEEELNEGVEKAINKHIDSLKKKWLDGIVLIQKLMQKGYPLGAIKHTIYKRTHE